MSKHDSTPKFPDSYLGNNSLDYDSSIWMERNQKKTTLLCLQYLYDERLDNLEKSDFLKDEPSFILDLGCGTGYSTEILVERGFKVVGIDVLHDMISKVKHKKNLMTNQNNLELILADINYLPLRNSSISHAISISAYNFITHRAESIRDKVKIAHNTAKNLHKMLKPDGRVIIEFYPKDDNELEMFASSFNTNGFNGFIVKQNPNQKSGQTFLLLKKR
ncbi:MAG: class I SAM-dependent methyltransferase [Candidatus Lokiarchaeota archaeon]|nr:class I SAM-dependent methyltransferase [Candidatus Lokiarchaeota archaeon]